MMGKMRVELAQSARDDFADIIEWYTSQGVPRVGVRPVTEIRDPLRQLNTFPDSGKVVPEFATPWLRELEYPPFRIVYRGNEDAVTVVRVWRSARLMDIRLPGNA
jgi:plasmid stabilization system protein ParE